MTRIEARVVYAKDFFEIGFGSAQALIHRPYLGPDRGDIVAAYAIAELKDSEDQIEVMTRAELDLVRMRSPSSNDGPWVSDFAEMARKTVLRRLCKYLPFATAVEDALAGEESVESDPPAEQEPPRKQVEAHTVPDGVDPDTGELLGEAGQAYTDGTEEAVAAAATDGQSQEPASEGADPPITGAAVSDFAAQKRSMPAQIQDEMNLRYPDGSVAGQAARLNVLKHVFGSPDPTRMGNLPLEVLKAGLEYLKSQANQETQA